MITAPYDNNSSLFTPLFSDGRHLLTLGTLGLLFSGSFALFLAATGQFLPQDTQFLGMTARELCTHNACNIVHFMIHDRVSFGGTLLAISILYFWLIHFPLRDHQPWAWWTLVLSNIAGFASFLTYLGYGYLDTWHGFATLFLLPCFALGFALTYPTLQHPRGLGTILKPSMKPSLRSPGAIGRLLLLATAVGLIGAGSVISVIGMTVVFVPQDLEYMNTTIPALNTLNTHLIPLIAHDRAGFGGGVFNVGLLILACAWRGKPAKNLWQALALAGGIGFTLAIGVHPIVGYNNPVHLTPACLGGASFLLAIILTAKPMLRNQPA